MDDHGRPFGKSDLRRRRGGGLATDGTLTEHGWKEKDEAAVKFRDYQREIFLDHKSGIVVLHWARQIGKSFTLAAWAVYRLLTRPGRLVTVLSNSRENGAEFVAKCAEICALNGARFVSIERGPELDYQSMRMEVRIRVKGKVGRIKVLAANPRTARGFSGDLVLDEFAFHEDSGAIWAAAEPILASNPDFLCRIASTGNGQHNMFYRMAECGVRNPEWGIRKSEAGFWVSRVTRGMAFKQGVQIYDSQSRKPITPEAARAQALDKRSYDQNYECSFADENLALLSQELISAAEREGVGMICEQRWSHEALALMAAAAGPLYLGFDVGRKVDLSVITVLEKVNDDLLARGILRMRDMRLPEQELQLGEVCRLAKFRGGAIDMTGLGLGLFEYAQKKQ
jgi:phage FluMu gp28-like protein